jgi:NDP-sugar pyrophosphorylase family protein
MSFALKNAVGLLVLAGGKATRLQAVLKGSPKSLIHFPPWQPVLLDLARRATQCEMEVWIATDSRSSSAIDSYLSEHGLRVQISVDPGEGTGYAIRMALERMESPTVIVCNADTIVPFNILAFGAETSTPYLPVRQILTPFSVQNSGLIGVTRDLDMPKVAHWGETTGTSPTVSHRAASSSGAFVVRKKQLLASIDSDMGSFDRVIMPALVSEGAVEAHVVETLLPTYDFGELNRIRVLYQDNTLRNRLLLASGAEQPTRVGCCLPGVRIA